jgi:predicted nucleic acid-binding Zn ribbon protein
MRRRRRTKITPEFNVKSVVKDALHRLKLDRRMQAYAAWGVWNKAVGDAVARQAQPAFVRGGTLFVNCTAPAWLQQLQFMKAQIQDELNRLLENDVIKEIRFQIGHVTPPARGKKVVVRKIILDDADQARIDEALSPLTDPETREIARRLMIKEAATKKIGARKIS